MDFRTTFAIPQNKGLVSYERGPIAMLGSCFTDGVGSRLRQRLFPVIVNPLGPLYNPASICLAVKKALHGEELTTDELFYSDGLFRSFLCHTMLCRTSAEETCSEVNAAFHSLNEALTDGGLFICTLGTAKVYRHRQTDTVVANCHKLPSTDFTTEILSVEETACYLETIISQVRAVNPEIRFIFTVSPVRHLADGATVNSLSKATLLLAINKVLNRHGDNVTYFPAYELLNDDLRDYRFYAADMCHPAEIAVDYVFDRFAEAYFTTTTSELAKKCLKVSRRLSHRQLTTNDESFRRFRETTRQQLIELADNHPFLLPTIKPLLSITE